MFQAPDVKSSNFIWGESLGKISPQQWTQRDVSLFKTWYCWMISDLCCCRWTCSTASTTTSWPGRAWLLWTWSTAWAQAPCRWLQWAPPGPSPTSSKTWCIPPPCPVLLLPTPDRWARGFVRAGRAREDRREILIVCIISGTKRPV